VTEDPVARRQLVVTPEVCVGWVPAGGRAESRHALRFFKHGIVAFDGVRLSSTFPLGLFRVTRTVPVAETAVVYPRLRPVPPALLPPERARGPAGTRSALSLRGEEEFAGLREFRPGDSPRRIHWRSSARLEGRLLVRELEQPADRRAALIFDARLGEVSSRTETRFARAVSVAASLAGELITQRYTVDVLLRTAAGHAAFEVARGDPDLFALFHALAVLRPEAGGRTSEAVPRRRDVPTMVIRPESLVPRRPLEDVLRWQ
jgi:uncharacterized protein (DUF58 family)